MFDDKKIFQNDMKVIKASDYPVRRFKGSGANLITSGNKLSEAIENADGVPFQLIFGPEPGEGYYVNVGAGFRQLLGIESGDLTEKFFIEMVEEVFPLFENIPADMSEARKKFINGEIEKYKVEILIHTPSGVKKWIRDASVPLKDEETGKIIGSVGILFDISDRMDAIQRLARADERAIECDELKTAFLHNLSHEVRTPLNAIIGFSSLICEPGQDVYGKKEYLDIINNSADHLLDMMNNIFEISHLDAKGVKTRLKEVNIYCLMRKVYDRYVKEAENNNLEFRFEADLHAIDLTIQTDEMKLIQVISNLVSNAIKFTKTGRVELGYIQKDDSVEFYVSDTGIGIPDENKPHIFKRFYQAESGPARSYPGTGLGLAISKGYIELLGGTIWFTSDQGRGSEFRVSLPVR
jgi:signal transduction histidine kinase